LAAARIAGPQKTRMKNYYYNLKTQDLMIFDTESKEMLVLERLLGVRVLTTSDLDTPGGDEPVKHWKNAVWEPKSGKARPNYGGAKAKKTASAKKRATRVSICKKCGGQGHFAKTCKKPPAQSPPSSEGTPR
jgi:hypothetical protein